MGAAAGAHGYVGGSGWLGGWASSSSSTAQRGAAGAPAQLAGRSRHHAGVVLRQAEQVGTQGFAAALNRPACRSTRPAGACLLYQPAHGTIAQHPAGPPHPQKLLGQQGQRLARPLRPPRARAAGRRLLRVLHAAARRRRLLLLLLLLAGRAAVRGPSLVHVARQELQGAGGVAAAAAARAVRAVDLDCRAGRQA